MRHALRLEADRHDFVFSGTGQGDSGSAGRIARSDVSRVCVAALANPAARNVTLELFSKDGSPAADQVDRIFTGLQPDDGPAN
jgi:hypothetical protein